MSMAAAISAGLASIVGSSNVITDEIDLNAYRVSGIAPRAAVRPASKEEVAEIVRLAATEKLALVPMGARTKLGMNIPIGPYDLAVDLTRLDRMVAYDPDDMTLSVEPGIPLHKLAAALGAHRQFLPLTVPFTNRATVGGTIASGVDSPLRQLYGTARDFVLGMEFITGDGQTVKSGGRVVKNVSGYDLHKLMIGSMGSLGVITKVNFRTFPKPATICGFAAALDSASAAAELRRRVAGSPLRPLTTEILSPHAAELISIGVEQSCWTFLATYCGTETVLARYSGELSELAGPAKTTVMDEDTASATLDRLGEFASITLASSPAAVIAKISVVPARIGGVLDEVASALRRQGLRWAAVARGAGAIYIAVLPGAKQEEAAAGVLEELAQMSNRHNGNFAIPWLSTEWKTATPAQTTQRSDWKLMRGIKNTFDPSGIFAADPTAERK